MKHDGLSQPIALAAFIATVNTAGLSGRDDVGFSLCHIQNLNFAFCTHVSGIG